MWQKFDPKGTEFIPYAQLSEFVSNLDEPLGIPRPNRFKLISMNLPICQNETVHCSDILGEQKKRGKFKFVDKVYNEHLFLFEKMHLQRIFCQKIAKK
jgi:hypothetical protein